MKIKINWKELGKQLWDAVKPVLLGAIGAEGEARAAKRSQEAARFPPDAPPNQLVVGRW